MKAKCIATWGDGETCDRDTRALGLCAAHARHKRDGKPFAVIDLPGRTAKATAASARRATERSTPKPATPPTEPYVPGTLPHKKAGSRPSTARDLVDIGTVEPATRAQIGAALHAAKRIGLSADDLNMFAHMLTDEPRNSKAVRDQEKAA